MIRVTFDLLPGGNEQRARTIGVMEIANVLTRPDGTADYAVAMKKTPPFSGALRDAWRKGRVTSNDAAINGAISGEDDEMIVALAEGHHRTRRGVYDLLFRAMRACGLEARL
ncbi:hypothetical protein [Mesorhizobium sp. M00.F.Ca.ET.217.01.1.1]|uniref:hypothetical protein n=1 Tax=Mesorhizobium sp. M00.F.Ca.ET.217.01.1.1 TaxID=2500529 RepID=UPI000FDA14F3|nr:hypothetical protein [Mesorhizobium sp. M00.F.Ca.ET.217.01.1.1]TGQ19352.1 hypothetical protein EN860_019690 [Mesorhizobium sp. M00.F.Ca.ET.217.01.1.1]